MPNWYAECDDGHLRCYFDDKYGHELDECEVSHAASSAKWKRQRNMKPLPAWLQDVADARVFTVEQSQEYNAEDPGDYDEGWGPDFSQW